MANEYPISDELLSEYTQLFQQHNIPLSTKDSLSDRAEHILMISTHGYWGDPPPAGVPDTGGQTHYVLEVSKSWARKGRCVIIIARWFEPYPRVEKLAENLWLVRIDAGGNEFIRKEDIYPFVPEMAEASTAIGKLFGADAVMGHYADGMTSAAEVGERLGLPVVNIPHSMGARKALNLGFDLYDPETWLDPQYNFWARESFEISALRGANLEIANTPREPAILKSFYDLEFPNIVMPAGAGRDFFNIVNAGADLNILKSFGLESEKYMIFFGRLSEAKNIPGAVEFFAASIKKAPELFGGVKFAIVGGDPQNPQPEERGVEAAIASTVLKCSLADERVIRIHGQDWDTLASLANQSIAYVGMQMMEPFGMAAAEALASETLVVISRNAGISKWLKDGKHAVIVKPESPEEAADKFIEVFKNRKKYLKIRAAGREFAADNFSWDGIAKRLGSFLDSLLSGSKPKGIVWEGSRKVFSRRTGRAYHRLSFVWRGDPPVIKEQHKKAARELYPHIVSAVAKNSEVRVGVAIGGESGSGKTEIAEYLRLLLRREKIRAITLPGDAFFKLPPAENHAARINAFDVGQLAKYLGPSEVDLKRLDKVLGRALKRTNTIVTAPSDCRHLGSRRYENVPVDLTNVDVILVDLTYSLLLKNVSLKIFLESNYKKRIDQVRERNFARDPGQNFDLILKVLEIEHGIIQDLKDRANITIDQQYKIKSNRTA